MSTSETLRHSFPKHTKIVINTERQCFGVPVKMNAVQISFELPLEEQSALRQEPDGFAWEMRITAVVKWYELEMLSQSKAAEVAGLSRAEFLDALYRFGVSPFQVCLEEKNLCSERLCAK